MIRRLGLTPMALLGILLVACLPAPPTGTPTSSPEPPTATATPSPSATPVPTPTVTPTPTPLTSAEIFARVSPAVVFIQTPTSTGSGVLTERRYIVTNAHVVWPYERVRVVFPDGTQYREAPVLGLDLLGDLAVVGPLVTSVDDVELVSGESLPSGSDVYLIGHPAESEDFPQPKPTITEGTLSRTREWQGAEITYLQTDAVTVGGQSGGVLVSPYGEVIGIAGLAPGKANLGMVASAEDVRRRIRRISAGMDVSGLGDRRASLAGGQTTHRISLRNQIDEQTFLIAEPILSSVEITVESEKSAGFSVFDLHGNRLLGVGGQSGREATASVPLQYPGPYVVQVWHNSPDPAEILVRSNHPLVPYHDPDRGKVIGIGDTVAGSLDFPSEFDYFITELSEGDVVDVVAESPNIDPGVSVGFRQKPIEQWPSDKDSGGGTLGTNARLTYQAPHTGSYIIVVNGSGVGRIGGYLLTVTESPSGANPTAVPTRAPPVQNPAGATLLYRSETQPYSMQYPADLVQESPQPGTAATFSNQRGDVLAIAEEDLIAEFGRGMTLEEYTDVVVREMEANVIDYQLVARRRVETAQALPAELLEFEMLDGLLQGRRFIYVHEDRSAFNAIYIMYRESFERQESLVAYTFDTFRVNE